jgi:arylsulfatase A-like enzyme
MIRVTKRLQALLVLIVMVVGVVLTMQYSKSTTSKKVVSGSCQNCNVLLISVDSLRADHLSAFGYTRQTSPHFDAFAKQGTLFSNYFSTSFLTPVSEMSVQTGLFPTAHGINNFDSVLPSTVPTMAQTLKAKGYSTQAIISSPEFFDQPTLKESFSRGFDSYDYVQSGFKRDFPSLSSVTSALSASANKQTFLWLSLGGVHWPYGTEKNNVYADKNYNGLFANKTLDWFQFQNIYKGLVYPRLAIVGDADVQYIRDQYDNGVRAFDDFLGQVVDQLRQQNLLEKTIVIIESEHGEDLGEHGYFAHYDVLDTQTHTPLLILGPNVQDNKIIDTLASSVDVLPTLYDLLGMTPDTPLQGRSFLSAVQDKKTVAENPVKPIFLERSPLWEEAELSIRQLWQERGVTVSSTHDKDIAIRTDHWKYILRLSKAEQEKISWWKYITEQPVSIPDAELYDLDHDPGETKNIIADFPVVADDLHSQLTKWYDQIKLTEPKTEKNTDQLQPYF